MDFVRDIRSFQKSGFQVLNLQVLIMKFLYHCCVCREEDTSNTAARSASHIVLHAG